MVVIQIRGRLFLQRIGVRLALLASLLALSGCQKKTETAPIIPNQEVQTVLLSQYPMAVSVSPTGEHLLLKTRHLHDFEIFVVDRASQKVMASDRSSDTQLSLTWRPDGKAIAFQESRGGNREFALFLFELESGKRRRLNAPLTRSAAPPLRWSPTGDRLAYFQTSESTDGKILVLDMVNESLPPRAVNSLALAGDFIWSPNGQQIAAVSAADNGTVVVVNLETSDRRTFVVSAGGKIRHLAWAPNGRSILLSARRNGDEYYQLFELELEPSRLTQRATHGGDVSSPLWLPKGESFIYHLNQDGNLLPQLGFRDGSPSRMLGFTSGVNQVQTVTPDGNAAFMLAKPTAIPPSLYEINLAVLGDKLPRVPRSARQHQTVCHCGTSWPGW